MGFKIYNGRNSFYQWDLNQKLVVPDHILDGQIHFENPDDKSCLIVVSSDGLVDVPNILLQNSGKLTLWAYVSDDTGSYTREQAVFSIVPRQKPSGYVYEETEILTIEAIQGQVDALKVNIQNTNDKIKKKADALTVTESGNLLSIYPEENSTIEVNTDKTTVTRCRKNLLPKLAVGDYTLSGIAVTANTDGSIELSGTTTLSGTSTAHLFLVGTGNTKSVKFPAGEYVLSGCPAGGGNYTYRLYATVYKEDGTVSAYRNDYGESVSLTIPDGGSIVLRLTIGGELGTVSGLTFYPQLEIGSVVTEYEPANVETFADKNIPAISGVNNIYTDGTTVEATYDKSLKKAFEEVLTEIALLKTAAVATIAEP